MQNAPRWFMNVKSGPQNSNSSSFHSKLSFLEEQALTKYYMKKHSVLSTQNKINFKN